MPQPTVGDVHVNAPLTMISTAYIQAQSRYIANQVFPVVPVDFKTNLYYTYTKNDWFRDEAKERAPSTESVGSGYALATSSYETKVYAFHKDISDQVEANTDSMLNNDRDATEFVTQRLLMRQEIQFVTDNFTTGKWATDATPANLWSDQTASDPITDIDTGKEAILATTGYDPNTLLMGWQVFRQLKNHPDIVDRYKYTQHDVITEQMLAALFGVERVLVAKSIKATNNEGATGAYAFNFGKHALLAYVAPNPGLLVPSAGYTFMWRGVSEGIGASVGIKRIPMPWIESNRVEGQVAFQQKVIGSDLGYFFNGAVA